MTDQKTKSDFLDVEITVMVEDNEVMQLVLFIGLSSWLTKNCSLGVCVLVFLKVHQSHSCSDPTYTPSRRMCGLTIKISSISKSGLINNYSYVVFCFSHKIRTNCKSVLNKAPDANCYQQSNHCSETRKMQM